MVPWPPLPPGHPLSFSVSLSISHSDTRKSPPPPKKKKKKKKPMPNSPSVSFFKWDPVITVVMWICHPRPDQLFAVIVECVELQTFKWPRSPTAADDILRKLERLQLTALLCKSSTCNAIRKKLKKTKTYIPTRGVLIIVWVPDPIGSRRAMTDNPPPPHIRP